jgi:putative hydrolase of the HAD superfamily
VAAEDVPDQARPVVVTSSGRQRPPRPAPTAEAPAAEPARADVSHPRASSPASGTEVPDEPLRPADALVIDLDGVIRHWHPDAVSAIEERLGLPAGTVGDAAFAPERLEPAMRGELAFDDWCTAIGEVVAAEHPVAADAVAKGFAATSWDIDGEVLRLVDAVRVEAPVALMSNASTRLEDDLRSSGIADRFDAVVSSAAIGAIKPEPAAYLAAARQVGTAPERCLFVDDRPGNVIGARATGMQGHLFTGAAALKAVLQGTGLLPDDLDVDDLDDADDFDEDQLGDLDDLGLTAAGDEAGRQGTADG